jgi:lipopolysaccharide export LptBFGC system permease protein LptF
MIKLLLRLLLFIVVAVLVYNFFLGTPAEKEGAKKVFEQFKNAGNAVKELLISEKEKFDAGKYENVTRQVDNLFKNIKAEIKDTDTNSLRELEALENQKKRLKEEIDNFESDNKNNDESTKQEKKKQLNEKFRKLVEDTERLMNKMNIKDN